MPDQTFNLLTTIKRRTTASTNTLGEKVYTWTAVYTNVPCRLEEFRPEVQYRQSGERPLARTILYVKPTTLIQAQDQVYVGGIYQGLIQEVLTAWSPTGAVDHFEGHIENP